MAGEERPSRKELQTNTRRRRGGSTSGTGASIEEDTQGEATEGRGQAHETIQRPRRERRERGISKGAWGRGVISRSLFLVSLLSIPAVFLL